MKSYSKSSSSKSKITYPRLKCIVCNKKTKFIPVASHLDMRWKCWDTPKKIIACQECGLEMLYPQWTQKELNCLYKGYHHLADFPKQKQAPRINKYLPKYLDKNDLIVEIGCGRGENLQYLKSLGYCAIGIDKDETVCDNDRKFHKDYRDITERSFCNKVYGIQLFEHLTDPKGFVTRILSFLRENGKFILEVPNLDDPLRKLYKVPEFRQFTYIPFHLYFFNEKNLRKLFEQFNIKFKIIRIQRYGIINHLRWIILGRPGNFHPHIPILDNIYKWFLTDVLKLSDTLLIIGEKRAPCLCNC